MNGPPRFSLSRLRVLVVEDESHVAMLIEDMLSDLGCDVCASVSSVAEALRAVETGGFDLALLDVNVAGEEVFPVAEALVRRGVPFAFATGYGARGLRDEFCTRPIVGKPFALGDLERALLAALAPPAAGQL